MKNIIAIYRRELGSYFVSPIAYAVIGVFLGIVGLVFYFGMFSRIITDVMRYRMQAMQSGQAGDIDVPLILIQQLMGFAATVSLFMVPMLTMGSYAEERKRGTMEMLMTSPLTEWQIVLGKFCSGLTLYALLIAPTLVFNLYIAKFSDPSFPWRIMWSAYLGLILLGAVLIALGLFISSLDRKSNRRGRGHVCGRIDALDYQYLCQRCGEHNRADYAVFIGDSALRRFHARGD